MLQAQSRGAVLDGVQRHGVAPGARKMMELEEEAAQVAIETGVYGVYRCTSSGQDCTRIGPSSKCFCGHLFQEHTFLSRRAALPHCNDCACAAFRFVPTRPEEVGEWWLVRRKAFDVRQWQAKCRCGHSHEQHDPRHMRCSCGCAHFTSTFACVVCDRKWEDHETVFEDAQERLKARRPVGEDFRPLANDLAFRHMVFPEDGCGAQSSYAPHRLRPAQVPVKCAEKSVQIMHSTSGRHVVGQDVANRYGRVPQPPREWLYLGGGPKATADGSAHQGGLAVRGQQATTCQPVAALPQGTGAAARTSAAGSLGTAAGLDAGASGSCSRTGGSARAHTSSVAAATAGSKAVRGTVLAVCSGSTLACGFRPVYD